MGAMNPACRSRARAAVGGTGNAAKNRAFALKVCGVGRAANEGGAQQCSEFNRGKTGTRLAPRSRRQQEKSAGANRLTLVFFWLPDLGSNQGPTD